MQTKRILFLLLLVLGLLGIVATVYFLFWKPSRPVPTPAPQAQPVAELPSSEARPAPTPSAAAPAKPVPPAPDGPEEQERKAREALFRQARDFTSRAGTYSNADRFAALTQLYGDVGPDLKTFLEAERARLVAAHPDRGPAFAQTTRGLTSRLATDVAVLAAPEADVLVDAQQQIDDNGAVSTVLRQAVLHFTRANGGWSVSRLVWQEAGI